MSFLAGERLRFQGRPEWGLGQVLRDAREGEVEVFFEFVGRRLLSTQDSQLELIETSGSSHPVLDELFGLSWSRARHHVYVVRLDRRVLLHRRFREANPDYRTGRSCFYVGATGVTPEVRFDNHKRGYKANFFVRKYGLQLVDELYEDFNPMPYRLAHVVEPFLARRLRSLGHAVWQH